MRLLGAVVYAAGHLDPGLDFSQLGFIINLQSEVRDTSRRPIGGNRKIHFRVVEHPPCIAGSYLLRLGSKQRTVISNRLVEILDGDMYMQSFHDLLPG